jgi:ParB/RepB/Spo0J family partition protein
MSSLLKPPAVPSERAEMVLKYYPETDVIRTPEGNPSYSPAMLADLLDSIRSHGQLVPGFVAPLSDGTLSCIEGNRRLAVVRILHKPFWAFNLGRDVSEEERISLSFHHNLIRRRMSTEEIAERGSRYMELCRCTASEAAKRLNVSPAMLSRALGDQRIPKECRPRAERLAQSVRSLIAAVPAPLMIRAIEFAEGGLDGTLKPTRDQVAIYIRELKKGARSNGSKAKTITLRMNRVVKVEVGPQESAQSVAEDLKAIAVKLGKIDIPSAGWSFLFP